MALVLKSLRADLRREETGDWQKVPYWEGVEFKVSALTKPSYVAKRDAMILRLQRKHGTDPVPENESMAELGRLLVGEILHDWRGLANEDGSAIPYSPEMAETLMVDPDWREVRTAVLSCANELSRVTAKYVEEAAKN